MQPKIDWPEAIKPLLKKYKGEKHPLEYKNVYQLVVMVVLSAQDSDRHINKIAPKLFEAFPNMQALSACNAGSIATFYRRCAKFCQQNKMVD
jgi:endonuclease-3